ncbi:hypothetical protein [Oleispirillum naphthae]|uniref:hypothetical protein n=1 Tax=Oleispirillum naphthae TaxID=2838853 RepID=UPI00308264F3
MKPNFNFERAERARSKDAKKKQKREALAARRKTNRAASAPMEADPDATSIESTEGHHVFERTNETKT